MEKKSGTIPAPVGTLNLAPNCAPEGGQIAPLDHLWIPCYRFGLALPRGTPERGNKPLIQAM